MIPGGITDIDTVLDLGGIGFGVDKRAVSYGHDGGTRTMDRRFVTVRDDTGDALGVVSCKYQVIQNRQVFTFLEDLTATSGVVWESAGALRGGRKGVRPSASSPTPGRRTGRSRTSPNTGA